MSSWPLRNATSSFTACWRLELRVSCSCERGEGSGGILFEGLEIDVFGGDVEVLLDLSVDVFIFEGEHSAVCGSAVNRIYH